MRTPKLDREKQEQWQPRLWIFLAIILFAVAWVIAFIVENAHTVSVHWVFATTRTSLIWAILVSAVVGLIVGVLLSQLHRRRWRRSHAPAAKPLEGGGQQADSGTDLGG